MASFLNQSISRGQKLVMMTMNTETLESNEQDVLSTIYNINCNLQDDSELDRNKSSHTYLNKSLDTPTNSNNKSHMEYSVLHIQDDTCQELTRYNMDEKTYSVLDPVFYNDQNILHDQAHENIQIEIIDQRYDFSPDKINEITNKHNTNILQKTNNNSDGYLVIEDQNLEGNYSLKINGSVDHTRPEECEGESNCQDDLNEIEYIEGHRDLEENENESENSVTNSPINKKRRKGFNPGSWKRNVTKNKRMCGEQYIGYQRSTTGECTSIDPTVVSKIWKHICYEVTLIRPETLSEMLKQFKNRLGECQELKECTFNKKLNS
ncbi:unnamed protein product [Diabrotica balteata]|uniref:Uncharacterized protein n=1 Tax=Diabrotica balteata TaxID=107213 RepID=A0A9N9XCU4_DIABA|nr:unnamed protein product [Diabrotica balteata]